MTKKKVKKIVLIVFNVLIILGLGFTSGFYYLRYNNEKTKNLTTDQLIAKYEKEISKSYTLPTGDKASLLPIDTATAEKFKKDETNKEFFKDSTDGDVVLIYANSKLGILYRPSTKKIIKTGPLAFKQQLTAAIIGAKTDRDAVIAVLKKAFVSDITTASEFEAKTLLAAGNTVIVDLTGKNADLAARLATELKGKVGDVPEGQDKPADGFGIAIYAASQAEGI